MYVDMCLQSGENFDPLIAPVRLEDLSIDYQIAWNLYTKIQNQLIISPNGNILGINILALDKLYKWYQIPNYKQASLFEKVEFIFREIQEIIKPKEKKRGAKKCQ